jgi:hypothetical protein
VAGIGSLFWGYRGIGNSAVPLQEGALKKFSNPARGQFFIAIQSSSGRGGERRRQSQLRTFRSSCGAAQK